MAELMTRNRRGRASKAEATCISLVETARFPTVMVVGGSPER